MEDDLVIRKIKNKREYYYELTQKGVDLAMAIENILTILGEVDIQKKWKNGKKYTAREIELVDKFKELNKRGEV